jgi:hypothetical protein
VAAPPLPVFAPQAAWYRLTFGGINPSLADTVPNITYLKPFTDSGGTLQDGLVGGLDGAIIFLAGTATARDGGQKFLMWDEDSLAANNNVTVFCPFVNTSTPGRWIFVDFDTSDIAQIGSQTITAGGTKSVAASTALLVNIFIKGRSIAGTTTLNLPATPFLGQTFVVKDSNGDAGTFNIIVDAASLDSASTSSIISNYGLKMYTWNGTEYGIG